MRNALFTGMALVVGSARMKLFVGVLNLTISSWILLIEHCE